MSILLLLLIMMMMMIIMMMMMMIIIIIIIIIIITIRSLSTEIGRNLRLNTIYLHIQRYILAYYILFNDTFYMYFSLARALE